MVSEPVAPGNQLEGILVLWDTPALDRAGWRHLEQIDLL